MVAKLYGPQIQKPAQIDRLGPAAQPALQPRPVIERSDFQKILAEKTAAAGGGLTFSAHAAKRLEQRSIDLTAEDVTRLSKAVDKAAGRGARESLVLLNDLALVVSVSNRKVITAMETDNMKENVVTNIDSAVIA